MQRLVLSILGGVVVSFVLSAVIDHMFHMAGMYPPYGAPTFDTGLLLIALSYRVLITILVGYLVALWARERARRAVLISGIVGSALWLLGTILMRDLGPAWYGIAGAITAIPLVLVGGRLHELHAGHAAMSSFPD